MVSKLNRRDFLRLSALTAAGAIATACAKTAAPTKAPAATATKAAAPTATPEPAGPSANQAPMLIDEVAAGNLPALEERMTSNPDVHEPIESIGEYGGVWRRASTGMGDLGANMVRVNDVAPYFWNMDASGVIPDVFSSLEVGDGGKTYTFGLRQGMMWSDGEPFTVDDVMFLYEDQWQDPDLSPNGIGGWLRAADEPVVIEKIDDYTVKFSFAIAYGVFMLNIAASGEGVVDGPAHYLQQFHPKFGDKDEIDAMVSDAELETWDELYWIKNNWRENEERPTLRPWMVIEPPRAGVQTFYLSRNPYYYKVDTEGNQLPYIDGQRFTFVETADMLKLKAMAGEIDMQLRTIDLASYPLFQENAEKGGYRMILWEGLGTGVVVFPNHNLIGDDAVKALNNDVRWRKAISHCIDRDEINELVHLGLAGPVQGCFPASFASEAELWEPFEYDVGKANALLDELGLEKGGDGWRTLPDGSPLALTMEVFDGPMYNDASELIAAKMQAVGLNAANKAVTYDQWWDRIYTSEYQITNYSQNNSGPLLQAIYARAYACSERSTYWAPEWGYWYQTGGEAGEEPTGVPRELQKLFDEIKVTADEGKRIELFTQIYHDYLAFFPAIITAGRSPDPGVVKLNMRNVPDVSLQAWPLRTPWLSQCYMYYYES